MQYNVETRAVSNEQISEGFYRNLKEGRVKEAKLEGTRWIRAKVRQEAISRELFDGTEQLTEEDLDRDEFSDQPKRIEEKEPDSIATFIPFRGSGKRVWFSSDRFAIYFGKIESQHNIKNKFELMTYRSDIRKMLSDNAVYDMADEEDRNLVAGVEALLALPVAAGQTLTLAGGLTADNVVAGLKNLISRKIPIGKLLMTKSLYLEALKLPATSVGDAIAEGHYRDGLNGETKLWGVPVITTVKNDIIADNVFYVFAPQEFLGFHYNLQDATLYIEQRADTYEFWTYSSIGIGLATHKAITKCVL